jgi:hypothetical protein
LLLADVGQGHGDRLEIGSGVGSLLRDHGKVAASHELVLELALSRGSLEGGVLLLWQLLVAESPQNRRGLASGLSLTSMPSKARARSFALSTMAMNVAFSGAGHALTGWAPWVVRR